MLQTLALLACALVLGCAVLLTAIGPGLVSMVLFWGLILVVGLIVERRRYKPIEQVRPSAGWTDTGERFTDPETNEVVAVYYNAGSGERKYVRADERPHADPR